VKATVEAIVARYPGRPVITCLELHTYSSLNNDFLPLYSGTLANSTVALVYFNPHAIEIKKLKPLSKETVYKAFVCDNLKVYDNSDELFNHIKTMNFTNPVYLFMSSGDFDGFDLKGLV
jgi:UDP-N-acetylmuramate: L-alanyl-gamma-D-glutamyl-meso-diaminopimelate ligase